MKRSHVYVCGATHNATHDTRLTPGHRKLHLTPGFRTSHQTQFFTNRHLAEDTRFWNHMPNARFRNQAPDARFQNHASDVVFCDHASDGQYDPDYAVQSFPKIVSKLGCAYGQRKTVRKQFLRRMFPCILGGNKTRAVCFVAFSWSTWSTLTIILAHKFWQFLSELPYFWHLSSPLSVQHSPSATWYYWMYLLWRCGG